MGQPITWKNVGSTVSGNAAGSTMKGAVDTLQGAFNPLRQEVARREEIAKQNEVQGGVNLNQKIQEEYQNIGSLAEYNKMRESGQFDAAANREQYGYRYDDKAAKQAQENQLSKLRASASTDARGVGNTVGDANNSQLAGVEAFQNRLRELGASDEYINAQGANYMKTDTVNAAQYKDVTTKNTAKMMAGKTFGSNAELSAYVAKQKSIQGNSFDAEAATKIGQQQMSGAEEDVVKSEANALKARKESIDQFVGSAATAFLNGRTLDEVKLMTKDLPDNEKDEAIDKITALKTKMDALTQGEKADLVWAQQTANNVGNSLAIKHKSEMGKLDAEITALDPPPDPAIAGAVAKLNSTMGVASEIGNRYEKGWTSGAINALFAGIGKMTGTKVGEVVKNKLSRLILDGSLTRNEASGIIFTAEQYARENGAFGTKQFDNKMFEAMVDKMNTDLLKSKELKGKKATLAEEHAKQTTSYNQAAADWQRDTTKSLQGSEKFVVRPFTFTTGPSNTVGGNTKDAENKLLNGASKTPPVVNLNSTKGKELIKNTAKGMTIPKGKGNGSLAYRNNNPGNVKFAGQKGATEGIGGFAKWSTPEAGYQGLINDLEIKKSGRSATGLTGNSTMADLLNVYAPNTENDTEAYIDFIAKETGYKATDPISNIDTNTLAKAMAKKESSTTFTSNATGSSTSPGAKKSNAPELRTGPPARKSEVHQMEQKLIKNMKLNIDPDSAEAKAKEKQVRGIVKAWKEKRFADEKVLRDRELAALKKLYKAVGGDKVIKFLNSPYKKK